MLRIGFIGAGGIARTHRAALAMVDVAELIGVYDIQPQTAERNFADSGARIFGDVGELMDACDAIYILTPPHTHKQYALRAIAAGKHILCEKPIAISLEDGYAIRDALRGSESTFMIAFTMRFRDSYRQMKEMCDSGKLGVPLTFWFQRMFGGGSYDPHNWRYRPESLSGISIESLSHQIDLIRYMIAEIDSVYARVAASHPELPGMDNNVHIILNLRNRATATLYVSWSSHLAFNTTGINGTQGTIRVWGSGGANHDWMACKLSGSDEDQIELNEAYGPDIFANESRHFLECLRAGQAPMTGIEDGIRALEVSHAILRSSHENRVVEV